MSRASALSSANNSSSGGSYDRRNSIEIEGMEFGENGLTDQGWERALESARNLMMPEDGKRR
eukprot:CAMPEP_0183718786 /NCGR_PEP_ID=MMETSP0737-20130205/11955_1 /TAXON_ID=385413 /ORGANISM="Thalassiosira miniscula, Strain CCMP1093" /LENGTH=61 /DNA_ID=CAMNT_0025948403 /DNA_START=36 /DNA_END=218 /DNA_ORIENTATION=+